MSVTIVRQAPRNPRAGVQNRRTFDALGITCMHLLGAAGSGKTSLLEATLPLLREELKIGVVKGDVVSSADTQRVARLGIPAVQILTDGGCHLRADQLQAGLNELPLEDLDLLVVENVGSPICPTRHDLGEHLRASTLSMAGGMLMTMKYPRLYRDAALVLITKHDLLSHLDFNLDGAVHTLRRLSPSAEIICTDTRHRVGIDRLAGWLLGYVRAQRTGRLRQREPVGC
jgi:hydrogenase nickel incorporation protein HypB